MSQPPRRRFNAHAPQALPKPGGPLSVADLGAGRIWVHAKGRAQVVADILAQARANPAQTVTVAAVLPPPAAGTCPIMHIITPDARVIPVQGTEEKSPDGLAVFFECNDNKKTTFAPDVAHGYALNKVSDELLGALFLGLTSLRGFELAPTSVSGTGPKKAKRHTVHVALVLPKGINDPSSRTRSSAQLSSDRAEQLTATNDCDAWLITTGDEGPQLSLKDAAALQKRQRLQAADACWSADLPMLADRALNMTADPSVWGHAIQVAQSWGEDLVVHALSTINSATVIQTTTRALLDQALTHMRPHSDSMLQSAATAAHRAQLQALVRRRI